MSGNGKIRLRFIFLFSKTLIIIANKNDAVQCLTMILSKDNNATHAVHNLDQ